MMGSFISAGNSIHFGGSCLRRLTFLFGVLHVGTGQLKYLLNNYFTLICCIRDRWLLLTNTFIHVIHSCRNLVESICSKGSRMCNFWNVFDLFLKRQCRSKAAVWHNQVPNCRTSSIRAHGHSYSLCISTTY